MQKRDGGELKQCAIAEGMETLRQDGWRRVAEGKTTIEEVVRVTQTDEVMAESDAAESARAGGAMRPVADAGVARCQRSVCVPATPRRLRAIAFRVILRVRKIDVPATRTFAPFSIDNFAVSALIPPSTSMSQRCRGELRANRARVLPFPSSRAETPGRRNRDGPS